MESFSCDSFWNARPTDRMELEMETKWKRFARLSTVTAPAEAFTPALLGKRNQGFRLLGG